MLRKKLNIQVLGPERHLRWTSIQPTSALAHLIDENAQHVMAYIKPFQPDSRGCFGEISRHLLATALGINTPPQTWIHLLSPKKAREAWPEQAWPDQPIVSFASAEVITDKKFNSDNPALIKLLLHWSMVWQLIALDIWLDNIDSNSSNLILTNANDFVAIDGAECFGGQFWTTAQLDHTVYNHNKLAQLISAADNYSLSNEAQEQIAAASHSHDSALVLCEQRLQYWHDVLIGPDECHAAVNFLWQRLNKNPNQLSLQNAVPEHHPQWHPPPPQQTPTVLSSLSPFTHVNYVGFQKKIASI